MQELENVVLQPPPRILVIDDEEAVARAVGRTLRTDGVVTILEPRAAMERLLAGDRFEVIICDLMMPDMPGYAIFDALMLTAPAQAARIIFLTGGATTERARDFIDTVAQPVLRKPIHTAVLRAAIRQFLNRF